MTRLSQMSDPEELKLELQREQLRKMQWRRWERLILTIGFVAALIASSVSHQGLVTGALRWVA